jgi:hypothetical protein
MERVSRMEISIWLDGGCFMGETFSPYQMDPGMGHAKEEITGDPNDVLHICQRKEV